MKIITSDFSQYKKQIEDFLSTLQSEKKYFNLTIDRLMKCEFVIIEQVNNKIIAVAGLEKKFGIIRDVIMIKAEYQRHGLGTKILYALIYQTKERHALLMALIKDHNIASLRLHMKAGYKKIGRRQNLDYLVRPINCKGNFLYYLLKTSFPLFKVADIIRH
jgi:RimJ/RimL family protein N-acetyltransferase